MSQLLYYHTRLKMSSTCAHVYLGRAEKGLTACLATLQKKTKQKKLALIPVKAANAYNNNFVQDISNSKYVKTHLHVFVIMDSDEITSAAITLGLQSISSDQRAVIEAFMSGSDVFVCLPTGSEEGSSSVTEFCLQQELFDRRAAWKYRWVSSHRS